MIAALYIAAFIVGLFLRTIAACAGGIENYAMNGIDFVVAFMSMLIVWEFRAFFWKGGKSRVSRGRSRKGNGAVSLRKNSCRSSTGRGVLPCIRVQMAERAPHSRAKARPEEKVF